MKRRKFLAKLGLTGTLGLAGCNQLLEKEDEDNGALTDTPSGNNPGPSSTTATATAATATTTDYYTTKKPGTKTPAKTPGTDTPPTPQNTETPGKTPVDTETPTPTKTTTSTATPEPQGDYSHLPRKEQGAARIRELVEIHPKLDDIGYPQISYRVHDVKTIREIVSDKEVEKMAENYSLEQEDILDFEDTLTVARAETGNVTMYDQSSVEEQEIIDSFLDRGYKEAKKVNGTKIFKGTDGLFDYGDEKDDAAFAVRDGKLYYSSEQEFDIADLEGPTEMVEEYLKAEDNEDKGWTSDGGTMEEVMNNKDSFMYQNWMTDLYADQLLHHSWAEWAKKNDTNIADHKENYPITWRVKEDPKETDDITSIGREWMFDTRKDKGQMERDKGPFKGEYDKSVYTGEYYFGRRKPDSASNASLGGSLGKAGRLAALGAGLGAIGRATDAEKDGMGADLDKGLAGTLKEAVGHGENY